MRVSSWGHAHGMHCMENPSVGHLVAALLGPPAARLMAGAPPIQAAAPRSLVPIMTTISLGACRLYSCPCSRRHCRCAAWSPAPLNTTVRAVRWAAPHAPGLGP